jgi:hypothetical protein
VPGDEISIDRGVLPGQLDDADLGRLTTGVRRSRRIQSRQRFSVIRYNLMRISPVPETFGAWKARRNVSWAIVRLPPGR